MKSNIFLKIQIFCFLVYGIIAYAQPPKPPGPDGIIDPGTGGGTSGTGARDSSIEMFLVYLFIVALSLIYFVYKNKSKLKIK